MADFDELHRVIHSIASGFEEECIRCMEEHSPLLSNPGQIATKTGEMLAETILADGKEYKGGPRCALFKVADEHFVQTHGIRTVITNDAG